MVEKILLPKTATEQLALLPPRPKLEAITLQLHNQVSELLMEGSIEVLASSYRTKNIERILEKLARRGWSYPILDVHGLRFEMDKPFLKNSVEIIRKNWKTPEIFPWGIPSLREYSEKQGFNPNSHPDYQAIHLNIVVTEGAKIAEIQLLTPEQILLADQTREYYQNKQKQDLP